VLSDNEQNLKYINIPSTGLNLKNLGKQIRWEHVFYIEYLGPILIMPLFYLIGKKELYTDIQCVALVMGLLHYIKR
jgi:very-long-chain enoyl-CoA reductase